jgi:hypothetical protein
MDTRLSDLLLEPDHWPSIVRNSNHFPLLNEVVAFSLELDEKTEGDAEADATLHRLYGSCARLADWLPKPAKGRAPHYTRSPWDLRALSALIPSGLGTELDGNPEDDGSGFVRWQANLHDYDTVKKIGTIHPSELEHNAALSYDGGEYGSAWTPNLALARILLAAYLLAVIQSIQSRVLPATARKAFPAALPAPAT